MYKRYLLYIFLLQSLIGISQTLRFKHITSEEGLPTNYVTSILEDSKGYMWYGTQEGLCKYDGYNIAVFKQNKNNPNSLSASHILCIYEHNDGKIYVGTRGGGLNIFDPTTNTFERIPLAGPKDATLSNAKVIYILKEDDDNIWIGTGNGVNLFNTKTKKVQQILFPLADPVAVECLYKFRDRIFVGSSEKGLWEIEKKARVKPLNLINDFGFKINMEVASIVTRFADYGGKLYCATAGEGIIMIDPQTLEIEKQYKEPTTNGGPNNVLGMSLKQNKLYAGTKAGFIIYDLISGHHEILTNEGEKKGINDDQINAVYIDSQENLWLGTFSGGINISFAQTKKFPNLNSSVSNLFKHTYSIIEDSEKNIWVGGDKSLKTLNRSTGEIKDYSAIVGSNVVLSLAEDKSGNLWIGTWGGGIIKYNRKTSVKETLLLKESKNATIMCLYVNPDNNVWVGTYDDGLFIYDSNSKKFNHFGLKDGLSSNNITSIIRDDENNYWIGTDGGGMCMLKKGAFANANSVTIFSADESSNSLNSKTIHHLYQDNNKNIWCATDFGISKYDTKNKKFTNYTEEDGLANNFTYSVLPDSAGNLWISTNKGITKFNPNITNAGGNAFKNYDQKDGLLNDEYTQNAFCRCSNGVMVFGSTNGINIFNPRKIMDNFHVPPVYVIGFTRSGKSVQTDTTITYKKYLELSWRENFFQFELAALDFNDPSKNKYSYKLENYDKEWSTPTNVRYVSYTELPGGDYVFKVKAANNDGIWNDKPFEIVIKVIPPFWKTLWFYIVVSVLGIIGIVTFTQYRTRAIKRENKILEQKVEERTKELAEKNRDITASIEYAKRIQEAILPSKELIYESFKNAFILYKPKDIVSGDFYWFAIRNNCKILAVVDCTGHGVPGAFMSMIGHNLLNQIVQERGITEPGEILNNLHKGIQAALKQGQNQVNTNDGMDVSLLSVNHEKNEVKWAGAFRPLVIVRANGTLEKVDGNKFPVGGAQMDVNRIFLTHDITINKNDSIYMSSDGYADQFGGEKGKKFMVKKFNEILCNIHLQDMNGQKARLNNEIEQWRGNHEQVDDVLVAGIRF